MSKPLCADCGEPCSWGAVRCWTCSRVHVERFARALGKQRHHALHQEKIVCGKCGTVRSRDDMLCVCEKADKTGRSGYVWRSR